MKKGWSSAPPFFVFGAAGRLNQKTDDSYFASVIFTMREETMPEAMPVAS